MSAEIINDTIPGDLLIVDDICDGGGTFTLLAKAICEVKPDCNIDLVVSHGIFSRGLPIEGIRHVFATDSFQLLDDSEHATQVPLSL